jgi:hypothetical protein
LRSIPPCVRPWLLAIGLVYAAYLVAGNLFLNTPIGRYAINQKPERFRAQWGIALTLWPGDLLVWNLALHGHAHTHLWMAHADFARGRIAILPLFHREFRMHSVNGTQVSIEDDAAPFDLLPTGDPNNAWTFHFDDIASTSLRTLRAGNLVLEGSGTMAVAFIKHVHGGPSQLLPSQVSMREAHLRYGQIELLRAATVSSDIAIAQHTHAQASGLKLLSLTHATLAVQGIAPGIAMQGDVPWKAKGIKAAGAGLVTIDLAIANGVLQPGGRFAWSAPIRIVDAKGVVREDNRATVTASIQDAAIAIHAEVPPAPASRAPNSSALNSSAPDNTSSLDADLQLAGRQLPLADLTTLVQRTSGKLDFDWHFTTLDWLAQAFARAPWLRLDGDGQVVAALLIDHGAWRAGSRVDAPMIDLKIQVLDNAFIGNGHAHGELVQTARGPKPHLHVIMDRFRVAPRHELDRPYVLGRDLHLDLVSDNAITQFRDSFRAALHFANAEVPELTAYNRYLPGKAFRILGGQGLVGGDFAMDTNGSIQTGDMRVTTQRMEFALGGAQMRGDLTLNGQLRKADATGRRFAIDGTSLALSDLVLENVDEKSMPPWQTHLLIDRGTLQWKRPFLMDAHAQIDLQNIRLLIALFARRREFPKWVVHLIDAGEVHADADVLLRGKDLIIDHLVANNNRFDLNARLHSVDGRTDADLYLHRGLFGLGAELHDGQHKFHLVGAKKWYASRPEFLPAVQGRGN